MVVGWGGLGVIIESNLNRVRLSCCWVGVGLGCDNYPVVMIVERNKIKVGHSPLQELEFQACGAC